MLTKRQIDWLPRPIMALAGCPKYHIISLRSIQPSTAGPPPPAPSPSPKPSEKYIYIQSEDERRLPRHNTLRRTQSTYCMYPLK